MSKYDLYVFKWENGEYPNEWNIGDKNMQLKICTLLEKDLAYMFAEAPNMLGALEDIKKSLDLYVPTCPICGGSKERGHKSYCAWWVAETAINKVRCGNDKA